MRALAVVAVLSALAACNPAAPPNAPAATAVQACTMAGQWRISDDQGGGETWTIAEDGTATVSNNMLLKAHATLTGNKLNWRFEHGDNHGFVDLTLNPDCQAGQGSKQYTQLSGGRNPGPATSVTVQRLPAS